MNWLAIFGKIEISDGNLNYIPSHIAEGPNQGQLSAAFARSDMEFENGEITFEVQLHDKQGRCQLVLNDASSDRVYVGVNVGKATYAIAVQNKFNNNFEFLDQGGEGSDLPIDTWISVRVSVNGSRIELFVNNVLSSGNMYKTVRSPLCLFMYSEKEINVRNLKVSSKKPKAFVVMQFSPEFNDLYRAVIEPQCTIHGFECVRADDIYNTGSLLADITRSIQESTVIIADITPNNPNVFYEVGYAHAINKPTILLSDRKRDKLPFDVSGFRTLFYDNSIAGKDVVQKSLAKHLENIILGR
jgi:nucleoside 2-deoxyribosyltransferase